MYSLITKIIYSKPLAKNINIYLTRKFNNKRLSIFIKQTIKQNFKKYLLKIIMLLFL